MRRVLKSWPLLLAAAAVAFAEDPSWRNKPAAQWDQEDAKQVLTDSPWVKSTQLQRVRDLSPDERRNGGNMEAGIGKGVGLAGIGLLGPTRQREAIARAHAHPDPGKVMVRWESAHPVRTAEQKLGDTEAPEVPSGYYAIVVYEVLTPRRWNITNELKGIAALKRIKQKDLKPSRVVILRKDKQSEMATVVYLFRSSVEISRKDAYVQFVAQIGRLVVGQVFYPEQMMFRGELEI